MPLPLRTATSLLVLVSLALAAGANARPNRSIRLNDDNATLNSAPNDAAFQAAFQAMLSDPTNIDKTLRYSKLAVAKGDYESAIPPLERLLLQNPSLRDVRLEVGVLYYLLDSHAIARGYLVDVTNDPRATTEQSARAHAYLTKL